MFDVETVVNLFMCVLCGLTTGILVTCLPVPQLLVLYRLGRQILNEHLHGIINEHLLQQLILDKCKPKEFHSYISCVLRYSVYSGQRS